eukprot:1160568-Pelagomonas_calceolata.AAC.14
MGMRCWRIICMQAAPHQLVQLSAWRYNTSGRVEIPKDSKDTKPGRDAEKKTARDDFPELPAFPDLSDSSSDDGNEEFKPEAPSSSEDSDAGTQSLVCVCVCECGDVLSTYFLRASASHARACASLKRVQPCARASHLRAKATHHPPLLPFSSPADPPFLPSGLFMCAASACGCSSCCQLQTCEAPHVVLGPHAQEDQEVVLQGLHLPKL